jgi:uncharacterized lipoprotein
MSSKRIAAMAFVLLITALPVLSDSVPKPLRTRLVIGDPVWRELPVRENLQQEYPKVWTACVNTLLENNFDIAVMDKDSGYIRTTWNEGIVSLGSHWYYRVQVSIKCVSETGADGKPLATKVRLQVAGEVVKSTDRGLKQYYRGYDKVVLENLFQDLQSKLGTI